MPHVVHGSGIPTEHIPEHFPISAFLEHVRRNPAVALAYVDWFHWCFNELSEEKRDAIMDIMDKFMIPEIVPR